MVDTSTARKAKDGLMGLGMPGGQASYVVDLMAKQSVSGKPRLQIIGTRGVGTLGTAGGAGDSNNTNADSRIACRNGLVAASNIRLVFGNYTVSSDVEVDGANDITVRAAIEVYDGSAFVTKGLTFNGAESVVISGRAGLVVSDPLGITLAPGQLFAVRTNVQVTSGDVFPTAGINHGGSYASYDPHQAGWTGNLIKNTSATVVYNTGTITGTLVQGFSHMAILGEVAEYAPAVVIYGDSIGRGSGDSVSSNMLYGNTSGFVCRGLRLSSDYVIPAALLAFDGETMAAYGGDTQSSGIKNARRLSMMNWATHVVFECGTNDLVSGPSLATMQTRFRTAWGRARDRGLKVAQTLVMPRTTGTYTSAAGQTPVTNFAAGELRDDVNEWIATQVAAGYLDYVIDPNVYVEDPAAPGKWISTGGTARTADGVHPNTQGHQDAALAVREWAERVALGA